jgi:cobalt-zinc-cadmium efflux system protein
MVIAAAVLTAFFVLELTTALMINSLALLSDAGHMLTDLVAMFMGLTAVLLARHGSASPARTYGWHRAEVFTAVANAVLLLGVAAFILYEAVHRLGDAPDVPGVPMILVALAGLVANGVVVLLLRSHSEDSLAVKGAYMEVVADTVGSIGVLIAGIVTVTTHWPYADVVVAVFVALWVLPRAVALARAALRILSESSPSHIDVEELRSALCAVDGVTEVHDLHVWTLVPGKDMVTAHLTSSGDSASVLDDARAVLTARGLDHATVQVEPPDGAADCRCEAEKQRAQRELSNPQFGTRRRITVVEQVKAALILVALADRVGRPCQRRHTAQEPAVGLVAVGHRAEALPSVAAQLIKAAVIASAGVCVGGDGLVVGQRILCECGPRHRRRWMCGGHDGGVFRGGEFGLGRAVARQ